jgi:hypothetical protein
MKYRSLLVSLVFSAFFYSSAVLAAAQPAATRPAGPPQLAELPWPQSFDLQGFQVRTYGFAVTQPGPIVLDVKSQGAPLDVVLQGPIAQPLEQQGAGALRVSYVVTPQDVQRGVLWHFMLRLTPAAAQGGAQSVGNVGVQHPLANAQIVQQAIQAMAAQRHVPTEQELAQSGAKVRAQRDAVFSARIAAGEQELVQRRAAIYQNLQPAIEGMRRQKATMAQPGTSEPSGVTQPPAGGLSTRALPPGQLVRLRPPPPHPVITSLSAAEGVPGDGIMITGSGFGSTDGEVHFVIGPDPSLDRPSAPQIWVNNEIIAVVPDPSVPDPSVGATTYNGFVYVVIGGVKSNPIPFRFDPIIDHRLIRVPADYLLGDFAPPPFFRNFSGIVSIMRANFNFLNSASGDDQFFRSTLLQNGWIVEGLPTAYNNNAVYPGGGISSVTARVGTNSPFTDVSSWVDTIWVGDGNFSYAIEIPIQGPRGLPDGVVCTSKPAALQTCPNTQ